MKLPDLARAVPRRTWTALIVMGLWQTTIYELTDQLLGTREHYRFVLPLDELVPFLPWTSIVYLGGFVFWCIIYLYCGSVDREHTDRFFAADFLAKLVCLGFFILLPTTIDRPEVTGHSVGAFVTRTIYFFDQPFNLFPSIHCMMSWLCYLGVRERPGASKRLKRGVLIAALAIFLSTLTTRQHVMVDALGGMLLAEMCYRVCDGGAVTDAYGRMVDRLTELVGAVAQKRIGKGVECHERKAER